MMADTTIQARHVRMYPYWVPSAQFAGYYVGIEKGIFKKHGIDLEIIPYDSQVSPDSLLRERKIDFAPLWLVNAIEIREKGVDIVNIAQFSTRSSLMLISKKSSGINKIEDINGKKAGIWLGFEMQPKALFKKSKLDVKIIPIGSTNSLFLLGGVDVTNANWFDEYHSLINNGLNEDEMNKFFFADYGLNFLEDGIYCLRNRITEDPDLCRDFMEATLESWNYAFNNQNEAIDIVVKYAEAQKQPVNRSHQKWMLSAYKTLYIPAATTSINTFLSEKDYDAIQNILMESRLVGKGTPYDSFYKPFSKLIKK